MIVRNVFTLSCPSCGAPLALTYTLASRSDQPRADSLEISRFLPCFLGKMAVFDKTEPLVMMPCEALSKTELSDEKELPVSHADGAHDETQLPRRRSCPTRHAFAAAVKTEVSNEKELRESHPMERMVRWSCLTRRS